ncbi:hypothetical protein ScPMuIL_013250 [Solemya velum]
MKEEDYIGVGADFIYDEKEKIDLPTLFNEHLKDLPKLCIVVDGIYGLTSYNNISSDQLLWIQTYSTQERVIVRESGDAKKVQLRYLSIPLDFDGTFRIVYSINKRGPKRTLREIVDASALPVQIMYTGPGRDAVPTECMLPRDRNLLLIKKRKDHFFLGNCLVRDQPYPKPTVLMMEPDITVCFIKGRKSMATGEFIDYTESIRKFIAKETKYDRTCGYPEIVDVLPDELGVQDGHIVLPRSPDGKSCIPIKEAFLRNTDDTPPVIPPRVKINMYDEIGTVEELKKERIEMPERAKPQKKKKPLDLLTKKTPKKEDAEPLEEDDGDDIYEPVDDIYQERPALPLARSSTPGVFKSLLTKHFHGLTPKDIRCKDTSARRAVVHPQPARKSATVSNNDKNPASPKTPASNTFITSEPVADFTIDQVCSCLSLLGLDQFVNTFRTERVDGTILLALDTNVLKDDFKFTSTQAIRLMKFIQEGHLPK